MTSIEYIGKDKNEYSYFEKGLRCELKSNKLLIMEVMAPLNLSKMLEIFYWICDSSVQLITLIIDLKSSF